MAFFGLKLGLHLEMRAAHPHQKFQGVPSPGVAITLCVATGHNKYYNRFLGGLMVRQETALLSLKFDF